MSSNNSVKLISNKINRIEEIVNNFYKNLPNRNIEQFSVYNAKFIHNNVPCEIKYDLTKLTLEELGKLVDFTTQNFNCNNNNNNNSHKYSFTSTNKNDNGEIFTNVPYDLSNFTMEELEKLVNLTTNNNHNNNVNNNRHPSSTSSNKNDKNDNNEKFTRDNAPRDFTRKISKCYNQCYLN